MGWSNQSIKSLTLPQGATGAPRIFLGSGDPFATAAGAIAAIMFYWMSDEAFMLWVSDTGSIGKFQFANTDATGITAEYITGTYDESNGNATLTLGFVDAIDLVATAVTVNGSPIGGGGNIVPLTSQQSNANSAAIGTTETVLLTIPSTIFTPGDAWILRVRGRVQGSVANTATFRVRFGTTTAGTLFCTLGGVPITTATALGAAGVNLERYIIRDSGDPILTTQMVVTMVASTGTVTMLGGANEPYYIEIVKVGDWADYLYGIFL